MEETIDILKLRVDDAGTVADLRNNIKLLKDELKKAEETADTTEGWEHYQQTLAILKDNQNALKDAAYATSGSFEDVKKAAVGASESYNGLVNKMAELKREFRATTDAARRADLGGEIKAVNDELKKMDAMQGNFQRNVGNYRSILSGLGDGLDAFRKGLGSATGGINGMKDATEALAKSPMVATFSILVSLALKLADELKDNKTATDALKKGMDALRPVMDFLSGILEKVADFLADIITKVVEFVNSNGLFNKIIRGVMGVGNAILKFVVAPFKGIIEAIKVFKEQGVKGLGDAARAFGNEMKNGVSFRENFQAGQAVADTILSGAQSRKKKVEKDAKKLGEDAGKKFAEGMMQKAMDALKLNDAWKQAMREWGKNLEDAQKELDAELQEQIDTDFQEYVDALKKAMEEEEEIRKKDLEKAKATAEAKKKLMQSVASSTSDILGAIADLYETDEENAERNAKRIQNLRIAAATVDTISGAIGAFMQAAETIPPPYGQIVGAIEAAAITATGFANIAKMKATNVSTEGGSARPVLATAGAPTLQTNVSNVRTVTSSSEEARLNRMAQDQRVYILADDIQASQNQKKVQVAESSF